MQGTWDRRFSIITVIICAVFPYFSQPSPEHPGRAWLLSQAPRLVTQKVGDGQSSWARSPETTYPPTTKKRVQPLPLCLGVLGCSHPSPSLEPCRVSQKQVP